MVQTNNSSALVLLEILIEEILLHSKFNCFTESILLNKQAKNDCSKIAFLEKINDFLYSVFLSAMNSFKTVT